MARHRFAPERIGVFEDRFNVVGRVKGSGGGKSLSFNSHLDTIMSRDDTSRFTDANDRIYHEAWLEDGKIYGYPLVNCKGPMTSWLIAAKALKQVGAPLKGDIVLAYGLCAAEAAQKNVAVEVHAAHLVVHGTLHLLGYDHQADTDPGVSLHHRQQLKLFHCFSLSLG